MQSQEDTGAVEEVRGTFCIASQRALQSQGGFESAVRVKQQTKSVLPSVAAGHDKSHVRTRSR